MKNENLFKKYDKLSNKVLKDLFKFFKDEMETDSNSLDQYNNYSKRLDYIKKLLDSRRQSFMRY